MEFAASTHRGGTILQATPSVVGGHSISCTNVPSATAGTPGCHEQLHQAPEHSRQTIESSAQSDCPIRRCGFVRCEPCPQDPNQSERRADQSGSVPGTGALTRSVVSAALTPTSSLRRRHTEVMNDRVRGATVWVLLAVFAVAALVGVTATLNSVRDTSASELGVAVNDVATSGPSSDVTDNAPVRTLSPVELGILKDLGYTVTAGSG